MNPVNRAGRFPIFRHAILSFANIENFNSQCLFSNSPYRLPYSSCDVSLKNLVLDQLKIPFVR